MCQRKRAYRQSIIHKALHRKLKIEQLEPHETGVELGCSGMVGISCYTSDIRRVTLVKKYGGKS